jgi:hypothetical protein
MWWTRRAGILVLLVTLRGIFLGVLAVEAENVSRVGV